MIDTESGQRDDLGRFVVGHRALPVRGYHGRFVRAPPVTSPSPLKSRDAESHLSDLPVTSPSPVAPTVSPVLSRYDIMRAEYDLWLAKKAKKEAGTMDKY